MQWSEDTFRDLPTFKKLGIAVIHGEAKEDEEEDDGRASPPPPTLSNRVTSVGTVLPPLMCKEKPPISVVGDVGGRIAIMVCYKFLTAGFKSKRNFEKLHIFF